ncbi:cation:dicarboxylate symporter family transporter [Staphylococcus epidermidis]|uniref:cation:dicarboxylate symporter family transporter n=1 Tax=Staphylococcus epidermidis TaxID=1282 RepID=UPI001642D3A9|nr:cation:dicarboxylase symporter family transporter [Staphylococcus epidermidis]
MEVLGRNGFLDLRGEGRSWRIGVVIFGRFVGFGYVRVGRKEGEDGRLVKRGIEGMYCIVMGMVSFVLGLTRYGILGIMASSVGRSDFCGIWRLGKLLIA